MKFNPTVGKPLGAAILFTGCLILAGLALAASLADLSAAQAERDVKADFVARSLKAGHSGRAQKAGETPSSGLSIVAESETLAAASIDALVRSTARDAGGSVLSSRAEVKHEDASGRIEVQAVVEGRIEALQTVLFRLESGAPLVLVDDLSLQPVESSGGIESDRQAPLLHATLTLSAYWADPSKGALHSAASLPVSP